ncbi:MAG: ribosome silencing factor [Bacteroidota bacterium]
MTSKTLAKKIAEAALTKKAYDVIIMDLRKLTTMTDYFIVCSVDSDTQARAVADAIKHDTVEKGESLVRKEGYSEGRWVLLDYVDVVAHVFHKDVRTFYNLEKLWGDAKFEYISDEPPAKPKKAAAKPRKTTTRKKTAKK